MIADTQNIHKVQALLDKLDLLKAEGASALERIRVIQEDGGEILGDPEFSLEDAFDVERRHRSERQKKLIDLQDRLSTLNLCWETAPFTSDIKDAGKKLLGYLDGFVSRAERVEALQEIHHLGDLWISAPDVSEYFDCIPITPQRKAEAALKKQEESFKKVQKELKVKISEIETEIQGPLDVIFPADSPVEFEDLRRSAPEESKEDLGDTSLIYPQKSVSKDLQYEEDIYLDGETIRTFPINREYIEVPPVHVPEIPFEGDRLTGELWERALKDFTEEPVEFRICGKSSMGKGHIGLTMVWKIGQLLGTRLDIYEDQGMYYLEFQFRSIKWENRNVERVVNPQELHEIHDDPKKWLEGALQLIPRTGAETIR